MLTTIFVQPFLNILLLLYALVPGHDFGVAVILLTVLVRLAVWPLVTRQLHSQRLLQQLQPEAAKIREQAGGDRQKETKMLMELYKERGTNPFASLLPLLVQMPIIIGLFYVLRDSVRPAEISRLAYGFVQNLGPVAEVIKSDVFHPTLFGLVDMSKPHLVLAILAGLAQFYQARQMLPQTMAAGGTQAKLMKNMTYIFPFVTAIFAMTLPSALALYWMITSMIAAFQQYWVLLRDAHELEAAEDKLHPATAAGRQAPAKKAKPALSKAQRKAAARKANAKSKRKAAAVAGEKAE